MSRNVSASALVVLAALVALVPGLPESRACAPAMRVAERVGVNAEEAVILYDAEYKTEHFIRRANFATTAKDFGFLVPTPTQPELGETQVGVFHTLSVATQPRHVPSGKTQKVVVKRSNDDLAPTAAAPAAPQVLEERTVAGYDAVVLKAEDVDGLKKWLEDRQYDARPALMEWLRWYVEHQWVITAFKITPGHAARQDRWEKAVRMSFKTDAPFYPYREPEDLRAGPAKPRSLRVYFLADARYDGTLGQDKRWAGKTVWANQLPADVMKGAVSGFGLSAADAGTIGARGWYLTEFEDHSSPRPGTDEVYFRKADDQSAVERPPIVYDHYEYVYEDEAPTFGPGRMSREYVWVAAAGAVLLLAAGAFAAWRSWRRPA